MMVMKKVMIILSVLALAACAPEKEEKVVYRQAAANVPTSGLSCLVYDLTGTNPTSIPYGMENQSAVQSIRVGQLDANTFSQVTLPTEVGMNCVTTLTIPDDDNYTIYLASDDGSEMYLDGYRVISNDGTHGETTKSFSGFFKRGAKVDLQVRYFNQFGPRALKLSWKGSFFPQQTISSSYLSF